MEKKKSSGAILMPIPYTHQDVMDQVKLAKRELQAALGHLARAEQVYRDITEATE